MHTEGLMGYATFEPGVTGTWSVLSGFEKLVSCTSRAVKIDDGAPVE